MKNHRRLFLRLLLVLLAGLAVRCDKPTDLAGGVEVGNPAMVAGRLLLANGASASNSTVKLIPTDYNPNTSVEALIYSAVTDSQGTFKFDALPLGRYNLQADNSAHHTQLFVSGIRVDSNMYRLTDTLRSPGSLKVPLTANLNTSDGALYFIGTQWILPLNNARIHAGNIMLDSLPTGALPSLYYSRGAGPDSLISAGSTVLENDAVNARPLYHVKRTPVRPVLDGNLTEFLTAHPVNLNNPERLTEYVIYMLWDDSALYVGMQAADPQLNADLAHIQNPSGWVSVWQDDCFELMVDLLRDRGQGLNPDDYKFMLNVNNVFMDSRMFYQPWNGKTNWIVSPSGTLNNNADLDSGYTLELRIPWSDFSSYPRPVAYDTLGFEIVANDRDSTGVQSRSMWANGTPDLPLPGEDPVNDADGWGDIVLEP